MPNLYPPEPEWTALVDAEAEKLRRYQPTRHVHQCVPHIIHPVYAISSLRVIASLEKHEGETWYHVSVAHQNQFMCAVALDLRLIRREMFRPDSVVVQVWPPVSEDAEGNPGVLHLWERVDPPARLIPDLRTGGRI